jgi:5'-nucleotidase
VTYGADWSASVNIDPNAATGSVEILDGSTSLGTAVADDDGNATVAIDGTALSGGAHTLTVRYLGDTTYAASEHTFEVTVAKAASTTSVSVEPEVAVAGQDQITLSATVAATGYTPAGEVEFALNGVAIGTAPLEDGTATLVGGPINAAGTSEVTANYLGDGNTEASTSEESATLTVVKATAEVNVKVKPDRIRVNRTKARVIVVVQAGDQAAKGRIEVKVAGDTFRAKLDNGRAVVKLDRFAKTGKKTVRVKYLGNATTESDSAKTTFRVVKN